jgi:FkbM family methyltransferase
MLRRQLLHVRSMKTLYTTAIRFAPLRSRFRRLRARFLQQCGYSDPYTDIVALARKMQCDLFIDIGCHHGRTTQRLLEQGLRTPVLAVDPIEENLASAKKRLASYRNISFVQAAVSDSAGVAKFFLNSNIQTSSLLDNAPGNVSSFGKDTEHEKIVSVSTIPLDLLVLQTFPLARRIIIKSDTQGNESRVMTGGLSLLRNYAFAVFAEFMLGDMYNGQTSFYELRHILERQCGMVLRDIYPCMHDLAGRAVQSDALWVKPDALQSF